MEGSSYKSGSGTGPSTPKSNLGPASRAAHHKQETENSFAGVRNDACDTGVSLHVALRGCMCRMLNCHHEANHTMALPLDEVLVQL